MTKRNIEDRCKNKKHTEVSKEKDEKQREQHQLETLIKEHTSIQRDERNIGVVGGKARIPRVRSSNKSTLKTRHKNTEIHKHYMIEQRDIISQAQNKSQPRSITNTYNNKKNEQQITRHINNKKQPNDSHIFQIK